MEEDRKVLDLPTLVAAAKREKEEVVQDQVMMVNRVRKFVSSAVLWARDCPKMNGGSSNPKKRNLGAYAYGLWTCSTLDKLHDEKGLTQLDDSMCLEFLCGAAFDPTQEEDECQAHAAFLLEAEGFGVLDCGATPRLEVSKVQICSPRVMSMIHDSQMLILVVAGHGIWETVLRQRPPQCPDNQFEVRLLAILGSLCTVSQTNQNQLH